MIHGNQFLGENNGILFDPAITLHQLFRFLTERYGYGYNSPPANVRWQSVHHDDYDAALPTQ